MAKIEIRFEHSAGLTEQEYTLSDADFARFVSASKSSKTPDYQSDEAAMLGWQNTMIENIVSLTRSSEVKAAVDDVSDITIS